MNKLLFVCSVAVVSGCASTTQVDNANLRIGELESRLARIEKDLYRVEMKSAPKQTVEPKFVPATEVQQNVIDTKIDAFLKEYVGVQFGDSIDKFPQQIDDSNWNKERLRYLPVVKPFKYLDKAIGRFEDGKLYGIMFVADIDKKYSEDSTNERINQILADMAVSFGLSSNAFQNRRRMLGRGSDEPRSSYYLSRHNGELSPTGFRRCGAVIENQKLQKNLMEGKSARQKAAGEALPEK